MSSSKSEDRVGYRLSVRLTGWPEVCVRKMAPEKQSTRRRNFALLFSAFLTCLQEKIVGKSSVRQNSNVGGMPKFNSCKRPGLRPLLLKRVCDQAIKIMVTWQKVVVTFPTSSLSMTKASFLKYCTSVVRWIEKYERLLLLLLYY